MKAMFQRRVVAFALRSFFLLGLSFLRTAPEPGGQDFDSRKTSVASDTASGDTHPVLVELFTSEGCSSCPPADALLQRMDASEQAGGAQLIALSEHVDYWDHEGWKDPYSSAALTERQSSYVQSLGLKTPYTPQMIIDGTNEVHVGDSQDLIRVLQKEASIPKIPVHIGEVKVEGVPAVLVARIEAAGYSDKKSADVYVAVALERVESQVLHGENGGKHLTHVAVVLEMKKIGKLSKGKSFDETVQLKPKAGTALSNIRIVAFVQEAGLGRVVGAALRKPADLRLLTQLGPIVPYYEMTSR